MTDIAHVNQFVWDADLDLFMHPRYQGFKYSDGSEVEARILEILTDASDLATSSEELLKHIYNWPTEYHLSRLRHNLIRHISIESKQKVLELGAGCGAITRQLGETGAQVYSVEGSLERAKCAARRCKNLPNVKVFCSDFQNIDFGEKFDVVTLIGVLEYAPIFFQEELPLLSCLKIARNSLNDGGVLILAIENQLGLKYLCGAPEDHTGIPFDGVQDHYKENSVRTLGRTELLNLLRTAGFNNIEFQYPFPDYKLPMWVFTEKAFECEQFSAGEILRQVQPAGNGRPVNSSVDERAIWPVVSRNEMVRELSNSFLVLASPNKNAISVYNPNLLSVGYVTNRHSYLNTKTEIIVRDDRILVKKSLLDSNTYGNKKVMDSRSVLVHTPCEEPYVVGKVMEGKIIELLKKDSFPSVLALLSSWIDYLIKNGLAEKKDKDIYESTMRPEFFDCTPGNIIITESGLADIDREWRYVDSYSLRSHVLRCLISLTGKEYISDEFKRHLTRSGRPPYVELAQCLGVEVNQEQLQKALAFRETARSVVSPPVKSIVLDKMSKGRHLRNRLIKSLFNRGKRLFKRLMK